LKCGRSQVKFSYLKENMGEDSEKICNDGLQACDYLEDLNFQKLYGSDVGLDLGNAFEFQKLIRVDVLGEPMSEHMFCS